MKTKFVSIIHPWDNRQAESANKVILKGIKRNLDDAKELWVELLHEIFWSYYTTPHSTTKETPFTMVYGGNVMLPIEINIPSWWCSQFNPEVNEEWLRCVVDLINEIRDMGACC